MITDRVVTHLRDIAQEPDLTGTPYTIVREIARGGMAVVYEAHDARLDRVVALKVLALELSSPANAARIREEAKMIARLEHPGVVPIHDLGELRDGRIFYSMKLVRGETLSDYARSNPGRSDLLRLFLRICETVHFAHAAGIVHRDLKPSNVMVGAFGEVLVMDWGVAARPDSANEIAGTHGFMAPEQLHGGPIDRRADVFALGVILDMLVAAEDPRVPRPLGAIIAKATAQDVGGRYQDARALSSDIIRYLDAQPVSAYREGPFERAGRWIHRNLALVGIVVAYLVMRVIVFLWIRR